MDDKTLLSIPDHVPVGAVIGRGGSFCKSLREKHGVRCTVDSANRTVALRGRSPTNLQAAESEITRLFASFGLRTREDGHTFEVAACNGPAHLWSFHQVHETSLNDQISDYPYRLHQSGSAEISPSIRGRFWIKEFREDKVENVMNFHATEDPPKLKVSFGDLCFKLRTSRCHDPSIGWSELQRLRIFKDFRTRWSNFCRRSNPSIAALLDDLEGKIDKGVEPQKSLAVHLTGYEGKTFDLKYHLVDGQWKLHNVHGKRCVRSTYDVVLGNDISIRLRAVTTEKIADNVSADIQRILKISIPDGRDRTRGSTSWAVGEV
ncbi:hypothetical protein PR003_g4978 [Phytophthora rubi]|uniref:K Homology domain-containing protein n=1 Tax=Phytophthora rubi TaxID=129364 RepID=A0A6A4FV55_9STRA|nr:hypothetical protein PR002_g4933 [Phytophthora rubi]KAE9046140.1 hypothetical protein PR001_g4690 [Phytophthora rubi]KAE9351250.1 hypothetical protein PR003_g4978 [Phytophthora rubi]